MGKCSCWDNSKLHQVILHISMFNLITLCLCRRPFPAGDRVTFNGKDCLCQCCIQPMSPPPKDISASSSESQLAFSLPMCTRPQPSVLPVIMLSSALSPPSSPWFSTVAQYWTCSEDFFMKFNYVSGPYQVKYPVLFSMHGQQGGKEKLTTGQ